MQIWRIKAFYVQTQHHKYVQLLSWSSPVGSAVTGRSFQRCIIICGGPNPASRCDVCVSVCVVWVSPQYTLVLSNICTSVGQPARVLKKKHFHEEYFSIQESSFYRSFFVADEKAESTLMNGRNTNSALMSRSRVCCCPSLLCHLHRFSMLIYYVLRNCVFQQKPGLMQ